MIESAQMRIGIITFYNGNINYGGILQAYAMQKKLADLGYDARQVCLDNTITESLSIRDKIKLLMKLNCKAVDIWKRKKDQQKKENAISDIREEQREGFKVFEALIPHTEKSYRADELRELDAEFDAFITGSDQVWTPNSGGFRPVPHRGTYFLDFTKKKKISYAASFGVDSISDAFAYEAMPKINNLCAVSVREYNAKKIIQQHLNKEVEVVVDPIFLLSDEEWNNIVAEPNVDEEYVLTYVLGKMNNARIISKSISEKYKCKLYSVPFIGDYEETDRSFGDKQLIGIDPREFLGYIKRAKYIVTDSFHCLALSIIFEKQFIVVKRSQDNSKGAMNSRVTDLLKTLNLNDRLSDGLEAVVLNENINYDTVKDTLEKEVERSMMWLMKNILKA